MKSKKKLIGRFMILSLLLAVISALSSSNLFAQEKEAAKQNKTLAKQAKITMAQARAIAGKRVTGKIKEAELEKEHGKLVYSFDIRNERGTITEVQVDAKDGTIVSVEEENKAAERKEKQAEKQEKAKNRKS